jgi:hypothetical protein
MGRKSSAKATGQSQPSATPPPPGTGSRRPAIAIGVVAVVVAAGGFLYMRSSAAQQEADALAKASTAQLTPVAAMNTRPHPQTNLPPLQYPGYPMQRSKEVVDTAYKFAAEHPEILSYVPCYCGCEHMGHHGNEDCFVKARDVNGDVVEWEPHGMECAVCLDVAAKSAQMYASGSSVREIRAAIEKEWNPRNPTHTPTPEPPNP